MKLHHKIITMPTSILIIIFIISMINIEFHLKETLREQLEQKLRIFATFSLSEARNLIDETNDTAFAKALDKSAKNIATISSSRITYISDNGVVIADSSFAFHEIKKLDNHLQRVEVSLALEIHEGVTERYSDTLNKKMMYLAVYDKNLNLVVRASTPSNVYQQALQNMRWSFIAIVLLSIIVVFIFGVFAIGLIKKAVNNERALQESRIIARTREITLIQTMTTMLNAASTLDDAAIVLLNIMPKLLPSLSGAIFLLDESNRLKEVSHWGADWHHDIATMTKTRWLVQQKNPNEDFINNDHNSNYNCSVELVHDDEFIGLLQLVSETKIIDKQYQSLSHNLAPQLSSALVNIQLKDTLRNQAIRDPLTELYNRRFMLEAFDQALNRAERHDGCLGVLMIDLDHFKNFNDTYGHDAGDRILEMVAEQFKRNLRLEDIACRYGGEEFCIICPDTGLKDAYILAEKLRACVAEHEVTYQAKKLDRVTLSIGIATYPNHGQSSSELLQQADKALYNAKEQGRNCTVVTRIKVPYYQG